MAETHNEKRAVHYIEGDGGDAASGIGFALLAIIEQLKALNATLAQLVHERP